MNNKLGWTTLAVCCVALGYMAVHYNPKPALAAPQADVPQLAAFNGIPNQNVNVPGFLPIYTFAGTAIANVKCAQGVVQSSTAGAFTVDYSALGFTTQILRMDVATASPGTTITALSGMYTASFTAPTLTGVSGRVMQPATVVVGGMAVAFAQTSVPVYVTVCGV